MLPLVSVIIPVYQGEKYLTKCLDSLVNQDYSKLEIIIVNDGSTDGTALIAKEFQKLDSRILFLEQENGGAAVARNAGITRALGEYIMFVDADDWLCEEAVSCLIKRATSSGADVVIPLLNYFVEEKGGKQAVVKLFDVKKAKLDEPLDYVLSVLLMQVRNWSVARGAIYKSEIIKEQNIRFPEGYKAEDFVFNLRYMNHAKTMAVYDNPLYCYLVRSGSATHQFDSELMKSLLFIDKEAELYLELNKVDQIASRVILDSLLCRNIIILFNSYLKYNPEADSLTIIEFFRSTMDNKRVNQAFSNPAFIRPYWPSFYKRWYVYMVRILLHKGWLKQAVILMSAVSGKWCKKWAE